MEEFTSSVLINREESVAEEAYDMPKIIEKSALLERPQQEEAPLVEKAVVPEPEVMLQAEEAKPPAAPVEQENIMLSQEIKSFKLGEFLVGKVVKIDSDAVLVDIGMKSEGIIYRDELTYKHFNHPSEVVSVGEEIDVVLIGRDQEEGVPLLSRKRAEQESAWKRVVKAFENKEVIVATCVEEVKGGLVVDLGVRGFVPASQVNIRPTRDLSEFVGEEMRLRVIEIDRHKRKVVLSRRLVIEDEMLKAKQKTKEKIYEGQILRGKVIRLTDFGAFVDIGGIDGLIHISELAWRRIQHPSEVVRIGQEVDAMVIKTDPNKEKISLSLRQALPDPWLNMEGKYSEGMIVAGKVSRLAKRFAFVEIEEGLEGVIPLVELAEGKMVKPEDILKVGQVVKVKIIELKPQSRRIVLSLRQASQELEDAAVKEFTANSELGKGFSLGNLVGSKLEAARKEAEAKQAIEDAEPSEAAVECSAAPETEEQEVPYEEDMSSFITLTRENEEDDLPVKPEAAVTQEEEPAQAEVQSEAAAQLQEEALKPSEN
jgi:ribosomal protein S1